MKKILILLTSFLPSVAHCQPGYWQQEADYTIQVRLNDIENTLDGFVKIKYTNHSPDTLSYIWFHLWPNAFKNDRTAFSEQMLQNRRTDFYFSERDDKGYINRLDFRVDGIEAKTEDHPLYIDIVKLILPHPLEPGKQTEITTPFHEKLPANFAGAGHRGQSYQVANWYPSPAVYDSKGWHEMPFLIQGGDYKEFGNYEVQLTLPENYLVAASGDLKNKEQLSAPVSISQGEGASPNQREQVAAAHPGAPSSKKTAYYKKPLYTAKPAKPLISPGIPSAKQNKTLIYRGEHLRDFVWFADKTFLVDQDTMRLASGRQISLYSFYLPGEKKNFQQGIRYTKQAIRFLSAAIGEYPYENLSIVQGSQGEEGILSYPGILSIPPQKDGRALDLAIEHALGECYFGKILGPDTRTSPWMAIGVNDYYDRRYIAWESTRGEQETLPHETDLRNRKTAKGDDWIRNKLTDDPDKLFMEVQFREKSDQPITTRAVDFSQPNYRLMARTKTALWMKSLEDSLGITVFDRSMKEYYRVWVGKRPTESDLREAMEQTSQKTLEKRFLLLDARGSLSAAPSPRNWTPNFLFSQKNTDRLEYLNLAPAAGYNLYDRLMLGVLIHNLNLPPSPFQFILVPLYATNSKQINGTGEFSYSWFPDHAFGKIELCLTGSRFSDQSGIDSNNNKIFGGFYKIVPGIRLTFKEENPRSSLEKWLEYKIYLIGEKGFNYNLKSSDTTYYPAGQPYATRYLNQLSFHVEDYRALYPYRAEIQLQQSSEFYRLNITTNYFFNYAKGGGLNARFFAAKFGYIGGQTNEKTFETFDFQPKLTATRGDEDYTYSNYFLGRTESTGFASQQIMMKDGGLKIRTDLFQDLQGRSDNWVAAVNFNSSLPTSILPKQVPLKVFLDIGTYANAWSSQPETSGKFLYVCGLQLSLFKNLLNIYAPLFYSGDFATALKSVPGQNSFWQKLSFSLDIQDLNFKKIFPNTPF